MCDPKLEGGMGFKDLLLFNEALLGKQTWRLLHNKNSLFYRVLNHDFFRLVQLWKPKKVMGGLMHGRAS